MDWHYNEETVTITVLRPSPWAKAETWQVQVVFVDEPEVIYLFRQEAGGRFTLVGIEGAGEAQKNFD